jgi:sugar/nucleoside kinase (ribokinase family)
MPYPEIAVTGIGNAIVDVLSRVDEAFITSEGFAKGSMLLIDADQALALTGHLQAPLQSSGGSAANTIAGLALLGSPVGYIGKVRRDELGQVFSLAMHDLGVVFPTEPSLGDSPTARCIVLVTPDAQRTMCTYLGACVELGPKDIDIELIKSSQITYLEGYLWDPPHAREAFHVAAEVAHGAHRQVSLSLSDSFCVDRYRDAFREFAKRHVDVLFANELELTSLYATGDVRAAMQQAKADCRVVAVTRGAAGCMVSCDGEVIEVAAEPVSRVVDTTGAGDLFAAGFLHGLTSGRPIQQCAIIGGVAAAEIISHVGARPERSLLELVGNRLS